MMIMHQYIRIVICGICDADNAVSVNNECRSVNLLVTAK